MGPVGGGRSGRRVLVIAAHPDDELLGCGGTIARHALQGDHVEAIIACEGESVRYAAGTVDQSANTRAAAEILGIQEVHELGFPDQGLDQISMLQLTQAIESVVAEVKPAIVYCQWGGDVNRDHQLLFKAALVATRPVTDSVEAVYAFDTASSTEWGFPRSFVPDTWVDIGETIEQKIRAFACYESEVREPPHPRSLKGIRLRAEYWGSVVCLEAAEPFVTVRRILRERVC